MASRSRSTWPGLRKEVVEEVVEVAVAAMVGDGEEVATEVEEVAMVAAVVATEVRLLCIGQQ